jgi:dephospho-CoA kinase
MNTDSDIDHDDEIEGEPLLIGLTGGIGSGKSTVAEIFEKAGFPIINADKEARFVMEHDETVKNALIHRFGEQLYSQSGMLNAPELAEIVFASNDLRNLSDLNAIVHPVVLDRLFAMAEELAQEHDVVIIDIALLFELDLGDGFDYVIGVISHQETRFERLVRDRGMTKEQITARMKTQINDDSLKEQCDFIIENNGSKEDLEKASQYLVEILPYLPNTSAE